MPPPIEAAYAPPGRPSRPGWLVAICVIAIALGGLGLMNGAMGVAALVFQEQLQAIFSPRAQSDLPPALQEAQEEFDKKSQELQDEYAVPLHAALAGRMAVALGLLVGGLWCLMGKRHGREIFMYVLAAAIVFEVANGVLQAVITMHMLELFNELLQKVTSSMPRRGQGPPPELFLSFMRAAIWIGIILSAAWELIKVAYYLGSILYLRRRAIVDLFAPAAGSFPS
jgi:hypothetical protein